MTGDTRIPFFDRVVGPDERFVHLAIGEGDDEETWHIVLDRLNPRCQEDGRAYRVMLIVMGQNVSRFEDRSLLSQAGYEALVRELEPMERTLRHSLVTWDVDEARELLEAAAHGIAPLEAESSAYRRSAAWMFRKVPASGALQPHGSLRDELRRLAIDERHGQFGDEVLRAMSDQEGWPTAVSAVERVALQWGGDPDADHRAAAILALDHLYARIAPVSAASLTSGGGTLAEAPAPHA